MPLNASIREGEAGLHSEPQDYIEIPSQKRSKQLSQGCKGRVSCAMTVGYSHTGKSQLQRPREPGKDPNLCILTSHFPVTPASPGSTMRQ